jgi:CheY-like chemotaxis protein
MVDERPRLSVVGIASDGLESARARRRTGARGRVIDLHMPRLDGVSALARMRQDHPRLCLIAITPTRHPSCTVPPKRRRRCRADEGRARRALRSHRRRSRNGVLTTP